MSDKVKFKKEWFNPLYFIILRLLKEGVTEFYLYGGKSSAKTVSVCQLFAVECLLKSQNALIFRKEGSLIETTVFPSMRKAIEGARVQNGWREMDRKFRSFLSGNEMIFKGLDSDEKAKGVEGFSWILFDELNHFDYEEYDQALGSFRGQVAKGFFGTWNPVSEDSWVKTKLVDNDEWEEHPALRLPSEHSFVKVNRKGNRALIRTIYEDNYWTVGSPCGTYGYRDKSLLAKYAKWKLDDEKFGTQQYWINVIGEWGIVKPEDPYFWAYTSANCGSVSYNPALPVYASFDYNVRNTCTIWQIEEVRGGYNVRCLEELPRKGADLTNAYDLAELASVVARKFGKRGIKWTGDSTGNSKSGLTPGRKPAKATIETAFKKAGISATYFPISKNPNTDDSREYCNAIFQYQAEKGFDFIIDKVNCPELHADLLKSQAIDGGKLDKNHCNKHNYGHKSDTARYFMHKFCFQIYKDFKRAA